MNTSTWTSAINFAFLFVKGLWVQVVLFALFVAKSIPAISTYLMSSDHIPVPHRDLVALYAREEVTDRLIAPFEMQ